MKPAHQFYRGVAVAALCVIGACHVASTDGAATGADGGTGEGGSLATAGSAPLGGSSFVGGKHSGGASSAGSPSDDLGGAAGQAGGNEAGDAASSDGGASTQSAPLDSATAECDVDGGGCVNKCTRPSATCAVESFQFACEFELFHDVPTELTCGQSVTVGTANCGQCGAVAVKLYFDGENCWQGVPDCSVALTFGKFVDPHAPVP